ncbi:MAG: type I restriction enzyme HsdR N-terminal domain-containing protein [Chitinophagaceae bacterium]
MLKIEFPSHQFKIKKENGKECIFDELRKKWVRLTPEEWVRQNFLQYIIQTKKYPASLIAIEKEIFLGDIKKRCDIIVYKNNFPWMIVECKELAVIPTDIVFQQILRYNMALPVEYLIITNGNFSLAWQRKNNSLQSLEQLPEWISL